MPCDLPRAKQGAMFLPLPEAPQTGGSGEGVQHPRMGASVKSRVVRMLLGLYQPSGVSSCPVKVVAEGRRGESVCWKQVGTCCQVRFLVAGLGFLRVAVRNRAWKATRYHSNDELKPQSRI